MAKVVHFEIPVDDPQKSMDFYSKVFGWEFSRRGDQEYWMALTGAYDEAGIHGALAPRSEQTMQVVNTIDVPSIDDVIQKIEVHGGTIIRPRMPVAGVGWLIYFKDPSGNEFGAMQADPDAK